MIPYFKISTLVLGALCLLSVSCATRLQMDTPMVDEASGRAMLKTQEIKIAYSDDKFNMDYLSAYFTIQSGKYYFLHVRSDLNARRRGLYQIKRGFNLTMFTKADSVFRFMNSVDTTAQNVSLVYGEVGKRYWSAETLYVISFDDMKRLLKAELNGARIQTTEGENEFVISPEQSKGINQLVMLALQNGPDRAQFAK